MEPPAMMKTSLLLFMVLVTIMAFLSQPGTAVRKGESLQIGIKKRPQECSMKSKKGDRLSMHYTGYLMKDGSKFDSSLDRGEPFVFTLGTGMVIKGWDQGLMGMCTGEHRKLTVPPNLAYGANGAGDKIPGDSILSFDVELLQIEHDGNR